MDKMNNIGDPVSKVVKGKSIMSSINFKIIYNVREHALDLKCCKSGFDMEIIKFNSQYKI